MSEAITDTYPGFFVSFEGNEGAGKSTQVQLLREELDRTGIPHIVVRDPGGTELGEMIRNYVKFNPLAKNIDPRAELLMFQAARTELIEKTIRPALVEGKIVIADRFHHSTIAYQGYGRGLDPDVVKEAINVATLGVIPEITLLLQVSRQAAQARIEAEQQTGGRKIDNFDSEKEEFLDRVQSGYAILAINDWRVRLIDAGGAAKWVQAKVLQHLLSLKKFREIVFKHVDPNDLILQDQQPHG